MSTRAVGFKSPAPPSQAPVIPQARSATVDTTTRLIRRSRWLEMNAEPSRGTPAITVHKFIIQIRGQPAAALEKLTRLKLRFFATDFLDLHRSYMSHQQSVAKKFCIRIQMLPVATADALPLHREYPHAQPKETDLAQSIPYGK